MKKYFLYLLSFVLIILVSIFVIFYSPEKELTEVRKILQDSDSKYINIGGVNAHYKISGQGPNLFLVHGGQGSMAEFSLIFPELTKKYRVITLDLLGQGLTEDALGYNYSKQNFMDFIDQFLVSQKIEKTHILGHSLGGYMVMEYAKRHPEKIDKIVLLNSYGGICKGRDYTLPFAVEEIPGVETLTRYLFPTFLLEEELKASYIQRPPEKFIQTMTHIFEIKGRRMFMKHFNKYRKNGDFDRGVAGASLPHPKLIIAAEFDNYHDLCEQSDIEKTLSNDTMVIIKNSKHVSPIDRPKEVIQALESFL
ncbi:MAG: hypothetical protein C4K58_07280 [Flavobacteriaceae bacterium]|nr:MAG: hypothetical protein C4K58_07280 [Flavobacteriaceae bacterium]